MRSSALSSTKALPGLLRGFPLALSLASIGACGAAPEPSSVLLITLDTLRADHLGAYGSPDTRTPNIDRLAQASTLFERAAAPMPLTRPSHFSILTSLYPREHGVVNNAMALPDSEVTLPEMLSEKGFRTGAFVGVRLLNEDSGSAQGFDTYSAPTRTTRGAEQVVGEALEWLSALREDERFFLWVHLFDPHLPYAPPADLRGELGLDPELQQEYPTVDWDEIYEIAGRNEGDVPARYFEHIKALYRGDVEYTDRWVGELLDGLGPRLASTLTLLTADHGESFGNGVYFEHADSLHEGSVRIPLIVRYPPLFEPGKRVANLTTNLDVAPTVLESLGLDVPGSFSGRSLLHAEEAAERFVILQHPFYQPRAAQRRPEKQQRMTSVAGAPTAKILVDSERVGILGLDWKYLRTAEDRELYRLGLGEDEETNLSTSEVDVLEEMERRLEELLAQHPLRVFDQGEINPELLDQLKELGYIE